MNFPIASQDVASPTGRSVKRPYLLLPRFMKKPHRLTICATSIAAFLAGSPDSPGNNYHVPLGDSSTEGSLVTGGTGLTKTGGGTLVLTNPANNYTGVTTISNGSIVISNPAALGTDSSAIVVTGFNPTIGQITNPRGFGGGSLVLSGLLGGMNLTRDLSLQGQGPIADRGGALISIGNNTLSGSVSFNLPAAGPSGPIGVNTTVISTAGTLTLAGPVNVGGTVVTSIATFGGVNQAGVANYDLTGPLSGAGILSKQGGGTLFLNPSDSAGFSGSIRTVAAAGSGQSSVRISAPDVLGTRTATGTNSVLDLNGGVLEVLMDTPSVQAGTGAAHVFVRSSTTIFADQSVGGAATNGTLVLGQLSHIAGMTVTFNSRNGYGMSFGVTPVSTSTLNNSTFTNNLQGGLLTFAGNFWSNTDNTAARTFNLAGNGDTLIDGSIVANAAAFDHSFAKTGTGTLTVTGTGTTLDGNFSINGGTVATHRIVGGLLGTGTAAGTLNIGSGAFLGTLDFLGAAGTGAGETVSRSVTLAGTTGTARINASQAGSAPTPLIFNGPVISANNTNKTLILGGVSALENEIQSALSNPGTGALSVTKTDPGLWVLSAQNLYTGNTTISNGTLKLRANGPASTILEDTSSITFNVDGSTQAAGGRLLFAGSPTGSTQETVGQLRTFSGHGIVRVDNAGFPTTLAVNSVVASAAGSIDFQAPSPLESISVGFASGFLSGNVYFNGADFAYAGAGSVLRAPVYGTDAGFVTTAGPSLTNFANNEVTGSFGQGGGSVSSLKISGSQTLTLGGLLAVNAGGGTVGGILVHGGNATIADGGGGSISQGLGSPAAGGAALVIRVNQATDSLTLGVPITSSTTVGLAKNGLGTLILAAANNQAGTTNINEGTVRLAPGGRLSAANQGLAIRQGATLDLNGVTQPNNTVAGFNGAGTVTNSNATPAEFAFGSNSGVGTFSGIIQDGVGRVSVLKQSTGNLTLIGLNTYTGSTTIASTGMLTVTNLANIGQPSGLGRGDATNTVTNADSLIFTGAQVVSAATGLSLPGGLVYTGADNVTIDRLFRLGATGPGAGGRIQASGVNNVGVVFGNTAPIGYTPVGASVAQNLVLGGATTADNRINLQLVNSGVAGGSLSVNKIDSGKWVLGNPANSYTGATKINGGSLEAHDGSSLPTTSPLLFGGTLATPTGGVLETSGTFTRALNAGTVANTVNFNANGNFPGSGGFASSGSKLTANLGGASAPLTWGAGGFLMPGTVAATLRLNSFTALGKVDFQNPINLGSAQRTVQVDDNANIGADFATLSGVLSGIGGGLTKTGQGTLVLTGANTYSGTTNVAAGTLVVRSLGNTANPGATSVGSSAFGNTDAGAVMLGNGGATAGLLQYVGTGETSDRKIRLSTFTGTTQIHADGSGPLILNNIANDASTGAKSLALRGTNAGGNRIDGVLTDAPIGGGTSAAPLTVMVDGSATWILNAANSHSGNTNSNAGALGLGHDGALGTGTLSLFNGNVFAYGGDRTISNVVALQSNATQGFLGEHSLSFTQPLLVNAAANNVAINNNLVSGEALTFPGMTMNVLTANRVLTIDGPGETSIQGPIINPSTSAFGLGITKTGTGLLILNTPGSNFTQNGANLDIDNGVVRLDATNAIPSGFDRGGVVFTPDDGQSETATLNLNGFSQTINRLISTSTSASTIDNASGTAVTLTIGAGNAEVNYNGALTQTGGGAISLIKTGSGAGVLSGSNIAYSGSTTVQTGGSLAFLSAAPVGTTGITVQGGGGLSFINGAGSNFGSLATLNLGAGAGAATLGLDVGTTSDTLAIAGAATMSGTVNISIGAAPGLGSSPSYTLLSAGSGLSGATYALNGVVPGGYRYSLTTSDTAVVLGATATTGGVFFWRGDLGGSWSNYVAGDTNWQDAGGIDPHAVPGPLDTVVFSSFLNAPPGPAVVTTLDLPVKIDSLQFNGVNLSTTAPRVAIAPGLGANTLTIAPANSVDGIILDDSGGIASITAPVVLAADQTWTVASVGAVRPELIVTGVLSGTGNLTKSGRGTATITGNNTHTGRTSVLEGTLRINAEAALGANPTTFTANQLLLDGGTLRSSLAFTIDDANRGITIGPPGGTFDTTGGNIVVGVANVIAGPGTLRKEGANTLVLNAPSAYAGGTFINGGAIRVGNSAALGTGPVTLGNSGTVLELGDGVNVPNSASVLDFGNDKAFRLLAGATSATYSGDITVAESFGGNLRVQAGAGGTLTIAGGILQPSTTAVGLRVNEAAGNTGVVVLSGANTYGGTTEVRQGTLRNGAGEVIPGALTVNATQSGSATATYDIANHSETLSALTFGAAASSNAPYLNVVTGSTGTLTLGGNVTAVAGNPNSRAELNAPNVVMAATRTFSVADAANEEVDFVVAGVLTGPGAITKAGLGTMKIRGQALYTGTTTINAGILLVSGSISGAVSVAGGTLGGTGVVGAINAASGRVSPGESIGTLTAASLTMSATATFKLEIDTTNQATDLLSASGPLALALGGTPLTVTDLGGNVALAEGTRFRFLTYSGGWTGRFSFGGNAIDDDVEPFLVGANLFAIDYNDLGGTAVSLVVVPEPSIGASLFAGAGLLAGLRSLRRRK